SGYSICARGGQARDRCSLASCGVPSLLALEIEGALGKTEDPARDSAVDPRYEPRQSSVGSTTGSWRTAQTRHRYPANNGGQIHGPEATPTVAGLEDVSAQSRRRHRCDGPVRGADNLVPASVRAAHPTA